MDCLFTSEEIVEDTWMRSKKVSAHDSVSNKIIKESFSSCSSLLIILFNKILQTQIYLEEWFSGIITIIPKSEEMENPDNYRGIAINGCLSKFFSFLLNNRLPCFIN